ncbi:hypothetical protein RFI_18494 [Reticulomyxa filosa]|uniref:Phosphodiesterase n=1 Tax=Reticulomyxa filosa TaxID=46433 RepID=X6N0B7_RETFI|nr:hypothetical protein RFI_18494 [Reticulomyxa filosa]|eukprot:ETO18762.1 hypothetical protein RFI_18494 [Reticulomyxa filosa]
MLKNVEDWDFDVFALSQLCGKYAMAVVFCALCDRRQLFEQLSLNVTFVCNFFVEITGQYKDNPYHNYIHGVDVLANCNYFMRAHVFDGLNCLDILACLLSAACHDVGHPGNNNAFEVAVESELAVKYNDESVLENMHVAKTWEIMKKPGCNILEGRTKQERKRFRQLLIQSILATDMSKHKEQMTALSKLIDELKREGDCLEKWALENANGPVKTMPTPVGKNVDTPPITMAVPAAALAIENTCIFHKKTELAGILIPLTVHTGDLSNPTKALRIYRQWATRITEEFYEQGDKEKQLGIAVTPAFDRTQTTLPAGQTGFINHVVKPWFDLWGKLLPEKNEGLLFNENVNLNLEYMKKELEGVKKEKEKKGPKTPSLTPSHSPALMSTHANNDSEEIEISQHKYFNRGKKTSTSYQQLPHKRQSVQNVFNPNASKSSSRLQWNKDNANTRPLQSPSFNSVSATKGAKDITSDPPKPVETNARNSMSRSHSILAASARDIRNAQLEKHLLAMQELAAEPIPDIDNDYFDLETLDEDSVITLRNIHPISKTKKPSSQQKLKIASNNTNASGVSSHSPTIGSAKNNPIKSPLHHKARSALPESPVASSHPTKNYGW